MAADLSGGDLRKDSNWDIYEYLDASADGECGRGGSTSSSGSGVGTSTSIGPTIGGGGSAVDGKEWSRPHCCLKNGAKTKSPQPKSPRTESPNQNLPKDKISPAKISPDKMSPFWGCNKKSDY